MFPHTYPGGKTRALTFSYDDGSVHDRRLVEVFNRYGMKGTFCLNSGFFAGRADAVDADEVAALYAGHEVACHSVTHPHLTALDDAGFDREITADRRALETLAGYPVRGLSYPYGSYDPQVMAQLRARGIVYARTTEATRAFAPPEDWMRWHPTCHHTDGIAARWAAFLASPEPLAVFYIWGHSYEFDRGDNWALIEEFCAMAAGHPDVWYATNGAIYGWLAEGQG